MPFTQSMLTHKADCAFQSITAKLLLKQTVESFLQSMSQLYDKTKPNINKAPHMIIFVIILLYMTLTQIAYSCIPITYMYLYNSKHCYNYTHTHTQGERDIASR